MAIPQDPKQRWSLDLVSGAFVDGRRVRILCVIDDFSRECLAIVADNSLSGFEIAAPGLAALMQHPPKLRL
jgi:putative transposase